MMDGNGGWFKIQFGIVGVVILGLVATGGLAVGQDYGTSVQESAEWCEDHDGELLQHNGLGPSGGLHCEFDNGTSVHMTNVETGETA